MSVPRLRLLHETNPEKYFPAIFQLATQGDVILAGAHRCSVVKEWLRAWLRDRTPIKTRTSNAMGDLRFRLSVLFVRNEVIVMGFAPWDWRVLLYRTLAWRNRILYHTSWHDWRIEKTPRQPRPAVLRRWLRQQWLAFLARPNVSVIAVTPMAARAVAAETGQIAHVIPHAVPEEFFEAGRARVLRTGKPLRLLFVGEVARKKGVGLLLNLMRDLAGQEITLTVIGNGAMAEDVAHDGGAVTFLGPIRERTDLAWVMADHDVLVLPSQRTVSWEELFGIVIVEALAAGLAVLASDHVGPRSILTPVQGAGLLPEDDCAVWRSRISDLAADRDQLARLRSVQAPVAQAYNIETVAADWKNVILS